MATVQIFENLFFLGWLVAKIKVSVIRTISLYLNFHLSFLVITGMIFVVIFSHFHVIDQSKLESKIVPQVSQVTPIQIEMTYWQNALALQPTSRDILWNLSLLYQADGQKDKAKELQAQAQQIDPNFH